MNNSNKSNTSSVASNTSVSPLCQLVRDARGLSTVEYVILLALIAVAGIGLWQSFGSALGEKIGNGTDEINGMGSEGTGIPGL